MTSKTSGREFTVSSLAVSCGRSATEICGSSVSGPRAAVSRALSVWKDDKEVNINDIYLLMVNPGDIVDFYLCTTIYLYLPVHAVLSCEFVPRGVEESHL